MNFIGILICLVFFAFLIELIYYTLLIPDSAQKPRIIHPLDKYFGRAAYCLAYLLSLLRAPLGLLPYLVKLFIFFVLKIRYESAQSTYFREIINMIGDFVNLGLTTLLVWFIAGPPVVVPPTFILYIPLGAELVRLIAERVPITFSAFWQLLPHRRVAQAILSLQQPAAFQRWMVKYFARYCRYYSLSDVERAQYVLRALKRQAAGNKELTVKLEYIQSFRIIPLSHGLRSGAVRDVAKAEVFIHGIWTNDPWLLIGTGIRRAPWMFDPRYLRRPFYYMTEANRLATLCVLEHARYSPPYAIFQFGHEIRVARLHLFYGLLRHLGADVEEKVLADGTFQFDQFICWLERRFGRGPSTPKQRYLYSDNEVIADVLDKYAHDEKIAAEDLALSYTYPMKYVEEVLLDKIKLAMDEADGVDKVGDPQTAPKTRSMGSL